MSEPHTFSKLPNELLIKIAEHLGPPDVSACDPGWLVLPAIDQRFREVAKSIGVWGSGSSVQDGDVQGPHGWCSFPTSEFRERHSKCEVHWSFTPAYKGGSVAFQPCSLEVKPTITHSHDGRRHLHRYLGLPLRLGRPLRLTATWLNTLTLICGNWIPEPDLDRVSFARVPCLVAPALQELTLKNYIIDWRSETLKELVIDMDRDAVLNYRYPPSHLVTRLHESRKTIERITLVHCLSTARDASEDMGPALIFPRLADFRLTTTSREAGCFPRSMIFPSNLLPIFNMSDLPFYFLFPLAYGNDCWTGPANHNEVNTLTIREATRASEFRCTITGSRVSWPDFKAEVYASERVPRLDHYGYGQEIKKLDRFAGLCPAFMANIEWEVSDWDPPSSSLTHKCDKEGSAMRAVRYLFINGKESRLFKHGAVDSSIWAALLRQLPAVQKLYINAPCYDALAPLLDVPELLPELELLWLGCGAYRPKQEVNAEWLLNIHNARTRTGDAFEICLRNIKLVGDVEKINEYRAIC